ncbi:MAG: SDR family NAD(P)-dependent oxidoreductase [Pseudomonadota bacterium]
MPSVLVTGANRGIGLGFVDQYAWEGWRVHACCRAPDAADELKSLTGEIEVHALDVTDVTAIKALAAEIDTPLDVVIANAGVMGDAANDFGSIDFDAWDEAFAVNVRAVVAMAEAFAPHLEKRLESSRRSPQPWGRSRTHRAVMCVTGPQRRR